MPKLISNVKSSRQFVLVVEDDEKDVKTFTFGSDTDQAKLLRNLIQKKQMTKLWKELFPKEKVENLLGKHFESKDGRLFYKGEELPKQVQAEFKTLTNAGLSLAPYLAAWGRLRRNPTKQAVEVLFTFLRSNRVVFEEDGTFIMYKGVQAFDGTAYPSIHSGPGGKTYYKIGEYASIPKIEGEVPNAGSACGIGLHCAAWDYVKSIYGSYNTWLALRCAPEDVIGVPENEHKMRLWRVFVLAEVNGPYKIEESTREVKVAKAKVKKAPLKVVSTAGKEKSEVPKVEIELKVGATKRVIIPAVFMRAAGFVSESKAKIIAGKSGSALVYGDRAEIPSDQGDKLEKATSLSLMESNAFRFGESYLRANKIKSDKLFAEVVGHQIIRIFNK